MADLRRIGIDEINYKKRHKYLTVVVDHDTNRLVWAAPSRDEARLRRFSDDLGEQRCGSPTSRPMLPSGSPAWSTRTARPWCGVPIRCLFGTGRSRRSTRCAAPRRTTPDAPPRRAPHRRCPRAKAFATCVLEESRRPQRAATGQAGVDRHHRPAPVSAASAQGRFVQGFKGQSRGRQARAQFLNQLGAALPHPPLGGAAAAHPP